MSIDGIEFALNFFTFASVLAGIAYCFILIKEMWQKNRGGSK
jgi:hypothetical protein